MPPAVGRLAPMLEASGCLDTIGTRIASAIDSRRTLIAASLSTPRRSQKKAITGISGILTVGRIHWSS